MKRIIIIFSVLLFIFNLSGCKKNSEDKKENIADTEISENIPENSTEITEKTENKISKTTKYTTEKSKEIIVTTKHEITETEYTSENIAETTENSDDIIIMEEVPENDLQGDMPIIRYDNYEQDSPATTAESAEHQENTSTKSVIELPFVPVG